jgi:RNA-binding protein
LQRLGKAMHVSNSKNLIVSAESLSRLGATVVDSNLEKIGRVFDIFGPVKEPYISVKLSVRDAEKYIGQVLYTLED